MDACKELAQNILPHCHSERSKESPAWSVEFNGTYLPYRHSERNEAE